MRCQTDLEQLEGTAQHSMRAAQFAKDYLRDTRSVHLAKFRIAESTAFMTSIRRYDTAKRTTKHHVDVCSSCDTAVR